MEYEVKDNDNGSFHVLLNNFTLVKVYYKSDKVATPLSRGKAEELANTIKCIVESEYPISELNEEDYQPSGFAKLLESLDDEGKDALADLFVRCMLSSD